MNRIERGNLIFDGIDAQASGVLISGEGTFDSPVRVYEMVEVPGRNGAVAIDQGRYGNIEVVYPAAIWADGQAAFRRKLAAYRSEMASRIGYKRIEDTYHPEEFRLGIFRGAVEVEPDGYNTAGAFDLVFDCKPQRFLKSGETAVDVSSASRQQLTGNPVSFYWTAAGVIHALSIHAGANISGANPSPYSPATLTPWTGFRLQLNGGTYQDITLPEEMPEVDVDLTDGSYSSDRGMYTFDGTESITRETFWVGFKKEAVFKVTWSWASDSIVPDFCTRFPVLDDTATLSDLQAKCERDGTGLTFMWRYDAVTSAEDMKTMLADWYAAGNPMILAGDYATPVTGNVTVPTLSYTANAVNTLEAVTDSDTITIEADVTAVTALVNPTPFEAFPLVEITGTGTVKIGETTLTISANANPPIYLDCELMEAYQIIDGEAVSANSLITMDNHKFPSLPPGASSIQASSGITGLIVIPRWWRL